jgi:hypothetical protein
MLDESINSSPNAKVSAVIERKSKSGDRFGIIYRFESESDEDWESKTELFLESCPSPKGCNTLEWTKEEILKYNAENDKKHKCDDADPIDCGKEVIPTENSNIPTEAELDRQLEEITKDVKIENIDGPIDEDIEEIMMKQRKILIDSAILMIKQNLKDDCKFLEKPVSRKVVREELEKSNPNVKLAGIIRRGEFRR